MKLTLSKNRGRKVKLPSFDEELVVLPMPIAELTQVLVKYEDVFNIQKAKENPGQSLRAFQELADTMLDYVVDLEDKEWVAGNMLVEDFGVLMEAFTSFDSGESGNSKKNGGTK